MKAVKAGGSTRGTTSCTPHSSESAMAAKAGGGEARPAAITSRRASHFSRTSSSPPAAKLNLPQKFNNFELRRYKEVKVITEYGRVSDHINPMVFVLCAWF